MSAPDHSINVLVTGFGPFLDISKNPSWEIAYKLPGYLTDSDGEVINITVPPEPTPAAYHKILAQTSQLIEQHSPDLVIHMGLDVNSGPGVFKLERSALKDGYHDIPDIDRKVFTRAENKKIFAKAPASLATTLDVESAAEIWQAACRSLTSPSVALIPSKKKGVIESKHKQIVDARLSDDVGTYVCGFQYYVSMIQAQKRTGKRDVVFLHVPRLESKEEIALGTEVIGELIKALVAVQVKTVVR